MLCYVFKWVRLEVVCYTLMPQLKQKVKPHPPHRITARGCKRVSTLNIMSGRNLQVIPSNMKETNVARQHTDPRVFCFLQTIEFFLLLRTFFFLPALAKATKQSLPSVLATATLGGELDTSNGEQFLRPKETSNYSLSIHSRPGISDQSSHQQRLRG